MKSVNGKTREAELNKEIDEHDYPSCIDCRENRKCWNDINEAELKGILLGRQLQKDFDLKQVEIFRDSKHLINEILDALKEEIEDSI